MQWRTACSGARHAVAHGMQWRTPCSSARHALAHGMQLQQSRPFLHELRRSATEKSPASRFTIKQMNIEDNEGSLCASYDADEGQYYLHIEECDL